jgi:hypothetical protein
VWLDCISKRLQSQFAGRWCVPTDPSWFSEYDEAAGVVALDQFDTAQSVGCSMQRYEIDTDTKKEAYMTRSRHWECSTIDRAY